MGGSQACDKSLETKEKRHRRDIIDELIHLLNCRFYLGSAVYYHHAELLHGDDIEGC